MTKLDESPYASAAEHLRDELMLVGMFVSRAIARGRAEGWLDNGVQSIEVSEAALIEQFRIVETRIARTERMLPMDFLRRRLDLTLSEQRVLWALIGYDVDRRLRRLLDHLSPDNAPGVSIATLLALLYADAEGSGYVELAPGGRLESLRLIEVDDSVDYVSRRRVVPAQRVIELACGIVRLDREVERHAQLDDRPAIQSLTVDGAIQESVNAFVADAAIRANAPLIAIVGANGSGRKTLARNAIARAGLSVLSVDFETLPPSQEALDRALRAIFREARLFGAALVFENFDRFADEHTATRMRTLDGTGLATTSLPVVAIMDSDRSLRTTRGITTVTVAPLREQERLTLWREGLGSEVDDTLATDFAARYQVSGGVILTAARRAAASAHAQHRRVTFEDVHQAIRGHVDTTLGGLGTRVITTQQWEDVVLPHETLAEVAEMVARIKHKRVVFDEWGFAKKLQRGLGLSALFHGPPGTGKTMVAGLIARELGLDLYQVDLSRVISKWVGETEKQLATLFAAAESGHTVLLFDEADSLFAKRTDVKSSNDRYANLEVNYLLQRMESFAGITILTTNHTSAIDDAFRRRLSFRIEFPKPEADERERLWRAIIPAEAKVASDVDYSELADRYEMTGGYIRNAALRAAFFAAADGSAITREHFQRAATLEIASMGKVISGRSA